MTDAEGLFFDQQSFQPYPCASVGQDCLRESLAEEIHKQEIVLSTLKTRFNATLPVSRLPPEVLTNIFSMNTEDHTDKSQRRLYSRIAPSHVCRAWRIITIGFPMLWTSIDFRTTLDAISCFLARAKQTPLKLFVPCNADEPKLRIFDNLLEQEMSRLIELEFELLEPDPFKSIGPANNLRSLTLTTLGKVPSRLDPFSGILYDGEAPKLECLRMSVLEFTWHPNVCHPNLTTFYLSYCTPEYIPNAPLAHIFDALNGMPLLEHLTLEDCLGIKLQLGLDFPVLTLANLQSLRMICITTDPCGNFLTYLNLPAIQTIEITGEYPYYDWEPRPHVARISHLPALKIAYLQTEKYTSPEFRAALFTHDGEKRRSLRFNQRFEKTRHMFPFSLKVLPLSEVETMILIEGYMSDTEMALTFTCTPRLEILRILRVPVVPLLEALFLPRPSKSDSTFLPQLQTLEFVGTEFPEAKALEKIRSQARYTRLPRLDKIVYGRCTNLTANVAALLRELTGASDNFVEEDGNSDTHCTSGNTAE